jgi:cell division protease FtsH
VTVDFATLDGRRKDLERASVQLKSEFFGMDNIIDKVISSMYTWYILPELITRPVIVNLWGMTGVGKTCLVRRISQILNFFDRYVEVQMDSTSSGSGFYSSSIATILRNSSIEENTPGILLLDEIQRFKTVGDNGGDAPVERFQDVWMLLSDGKFAADSSLFREVEEMLNYQMWNGNKSSSDDDDDDEPKAGRKKKTNKPMVVPKFFINPWEAQNLKKILKLSQPVQEIMTWNLARVQSELINIRTRTNTWEIDYSKLLIFVSGNLDEAFSEANATEDCDTDADIYHKRTKKITQSDIKEALRRRFKPEQIARLGNNHIIYPSLSKSSYEALILRTCNKYVTEMEDISELKFELDPGIYKEIYENSVYPTQGTRPVFSSVHKIFSGALSNIALWGLENQFQNIRIVMMPVEQKLVGICGEQQIEVPIDLDMRSTRKLNTLDFNTMVAVHEAGHALVYAFLTKQAPAEVKINLASYQGGYNALERSSGLQTKQQVKNSLATYFAGAAAEEIVFGSNRRSTGCSHDIKMATSVAAQYVRQHGFDGTLSLITGENGLDTDFNTNVEATNDAIENLCQEGFKQANSVIVEHQAAFKLIVNALLDSKCLTPQDFKQLVGNLLEINLIEPSSNHNTAWLSYTQKG